MIERNNRRGPVTENSREHAKGDADRRHKISSQGYSPSGRPALRKTDYTPSQREPAENSTMIAGTICC